MISIVSLLTFGHYFMGSRENTIDNSCDFDIIRIKKDNITIILWIYIFKTNSINFNKYRKLTVEYTVRAILKRN